MPIQHGQLTILSENFKPPKLLYRESHLSELNIYATNGQHVWVEGCSGYGKTLTCRVYADESEYNSNYKTKAVFIKCGPSMKDAALSTLRDLSIRIPRLEVNGGRFASELLTRFPNTQRFLILIDEPERVRLWYREVADFAHGFHDEMIKAGKQFSIIFISQLALVTQVERKFSTTVLSRLKLKPLQFGVYSTEQIVGIIQQRLEYGLLDKSLYTTEALQLLAGHIYRIGGNMREALDIVEHAILNADKAITVENMREAIHWGKSCWWTRKLCYGIGSPHSGLFLYLSAIHSQEINSLTVDCPIIFRKYNQSITNMGVSPLSPPTVYENIRKNMIGNGLLSSSYEKQKAFYMKLTFNDADDRDWIARVGKDINWTEHIKDKNLFPLHFANTNENQTA
jgi:Cdc6-like AAA superfamily ATPase